MPPSAARPNAARPDAARLPATGRRPEIQAFLDALFSCFEESVTDRPSDQAFVAGIAARLAEPGVPAGDAAGDAPDILRHLDDALAALAEASPAMRRLGAAFAAAAPWARWSKRPYDGPGAARFAAGHGNALIIGPRGAEAREDVILGVSLMAPYTRYPDHSHPPDELYLVLSDGEWRQGDGGGEDERDWIRPGIGGTVRNRPGVTHAMRAGATPLLAVWALKTAGRV